MPNHPASHLERWLQVLSAFLAPGAAVIVTSLLDVPSGAPALTWPVLLRALCVCIITAGAAATVPRVARNIASSGRHRDEP